MPLIRWEYPLKAIWRNKCIKAHWLLVIELLLYTEIKTWLNHLTIMSKSVSVQGQNDSKWVNRSQMFHGWFSEYRLISLCYVGVGVGCGCVFGCGCGCVFVCKGCGNCILCLTYLSRWLCMFHTYYKLPFLHHLFFHYFSLQVLSAMQRTIV